MGASCPPQAVRNFPKNRNVTLFWDEHPSHFLSFLNVLVFRLLSLSSFFSIHSVKIMQNKTYNEPVNCNHAHPIPQPRGIAGTFDFPSSKSLLKIVKTAHCGDIQLVKLRPFSLAACYALHALPFYLYNTNPWYFRDNGKVKTPHISTAIPHPPPGLGGRGWLQVTSA